jgi:hypothetical protein
MLIRAKAGLPDETTKPHRGIARAGMHAVAVLAASWTSRWLGAMCGTRRDGGSGAARFADCWPDGWLIRFLESNRVLFFTVSL